MNTKERTFDDFDEHASQYRKVHTKNLRWSGVDSFYFIQHKISLLHSLENNRSACLLDFGCGDGVTAQYIEAAFPNFKITGIDVAAKAIAKAKTLPLRNSSFIHYEGSQLPFPDNHFEIIWVACVFHHIDFALHDGIIQEMRRVLQPKGRIYFFEHNPYNPFTRYLVRTCEFDKNAKLLTSKYAQHLFEKSGFKIRQRKWTLFFPRYRWLKWLINLENKLGGVPIGAQYFIAAEKCN